MAMARFAPDLGRDRVPEDVEILCPAHGVEDAFVVVGEDTSEMFVAWLHEMTWLAGPAEVLR